MSHFNNNLLQCKICAKSLPREGLIIITHAFTSHSTIAETLARFAGMELASYPALNEGFICLKDCYDRLRAAIEFQDLLRTVFDHFAIKNDKIDDRFKPELNSNSMETIEFEHNLEVEVSPVTGLLGRPFNIPKLNYVNTHMRFNHLQYVELGGPMCCGCDFVAETTNYLMDHICAKHKNRTNEPDGLFVCDVCYETCADEHQLEMHRRWFLSTEIFLCNYCSYGFTCKEHLTLHMSACIEQGEYAASASNDDDKLATDEALEREEGQQVVTYSNLEYLAGKKEKNSLDDHLVSKIDDNDDHSAIIKLIPDSIKINGYGCCFLRCDGTFDLESDLHRHVQELHAVRQQIHRSERKSDRYVCDTCQLNFKSSKTLQRHQNGWKLKLKNVCINCGKGFVTPGALKDHVQLLHLDTTLQFRCECCGKQFKKNSLLKLHRVTHQQNRQYGCDQCEARFHFGYQLKKHQQAVHAKEFPYDCKHCKRKMPNKHRYDLHMRMHTGEKPYACRHDCGRMFAHATDRRRHEMVTHTGEKPHRCSSCSMAYVRRRDLLQHYRQFPAHDTDITVC